MQRVKGRKGQKGRGTHELTFHRHVARTYLEGDLSLQQLSVQFNLPRQTISRWAKRFSSELSVEQSEVNMTQEEQKEFETLKKQNEALKKKLEYEQLKTFALETMIDLAKSELGIDLRKNSGAKRPEP